MAKPSETERKALDGLLTEYIDNDVEPEKLRQYLEVRKAHLYYDGKQELVFTQDPERRTIDLTTLGARADDLDEDQDYADFRINIVRGDGRKYKAVLGNRAPNAKAKPDNPNDERALANCRTGDALASVFYSWWRMKQTHRQLCLGQWKSGTQFIHTPYITDGSRYGFHEEPEWGTASGEVAPAGYRCTACGSWSSESEAVTEAGEVACPDCGQPLALEDYQEPEIGEVPVQGSPKKYEKGRVECHLYNSLHVTVPFHSASREDLPWLRLEVEAEKGRLLERFPKLRDEIMHGDEGGVDSGAAADTRAQVTNPSGDSRRSKGVITYVRYWIRPYEFNLIPDEAARANLKKKFPSGAKITKIGRHLVDIVGENLDDVWTICLPEVTDRIYELPLCSDHLQVQDVVNLLLNIGVETLERGVAWMLADPSVVDFEQLSRRVRRPAEVVPIVPGQGNALHGALRDAPTSSFSNQLMPFQQGTHEMAREAAGVQRTIFGGEVKGDITARQYEGQRNQAMMQLSDPWDCLRDAEAQALMNAVKQYVAHGPGFVEDPATGDTLDLKEFTTEGWHYEIEESIPITPGQRADRLLFLMDKPNISQELELTHPENSDWLHDLLGMTGLKRPTAEAIEAAKDAIQRLLQEQPVEEPGPDGPISRPSIEPRWEEDSDLCIAVVKAWALTKSGAMQAEANPDGYMNVIAWGQAHEERLMAMQGPPPGEEEAPPRGPTGKELPPQPEVPIAA